MATKPMKTLKLPGLGDTYTFLQNDATLTQSGKAADAKATGDALAAVQTQVDGVQVGQELGAGQLLSTTGTANPTPYTYRANASGSDRVTISQITGGTVAWHQLAHMPSSYPTPNEPIHLSSSAKSATFSGAGYNYTTYVHKYLVTITVSNAANGGSDKFGVQAVGISISALARSIENGSYATIVEGNPNGSLTKTTVFVYLSSSASDTAAMDVTNVQLFDLTQMFGGAVADYIYGLETATAGAGVALFRQMFPESYYPYNAGELVSVQTSAHKMTGKNLVEYTARIPATIQGVKWDVASDGTIIADRVSSSSNVSDLTYIQAVMPAGHYVFRRFGSGSSASGSTYQANIVIGTENHWGTSDYRFDLTGNTQIKVILRVYSSYSGRAVFEPMICFADAPSGFEPYKAWSYPLDSTLTLRGVPVLTDGVPAYDGDQYSPTGTVTRRYGIYTYTGNESVSTPASSTTGNKYYRIATPNAKTGAANKVGHIIFASLPTVTQNDIYYERVTDAVGAWNSEDGWISVITSTATSTDDIKAYMAGKTIIYELATPTTETAAPYQEIQIAGSTEEFLPPATDTRAVAVPVGSVSLYQTNLRAGLETLLNTDLAHAESIAPVQGSTASTNISSGELLMKDGKLYKATQAIVAGAEIGSTNTAETTLAAQLAALEARIAALEN